MCTNIATIVLKSHGCIQRVLYNLLVSENIADSDHQQVENVGIFYVDVINKALAVNKLIMNFMQK